MEMQGKIEDTGLIKERMIVLLVQIGIKGVIEVIKVLLIVEMIIDRVIDTITMEEKEVILQMIIPVINDTKLQ